MASRCVLCRASSVLRSTLELELPEAGELRLPADKAESWRMALSLLSLEVRAEVVVVYTSKDFKSG